MQINHKNTTNKRHLIQNTIMNGAFLWMCTFLQALAAWKQLMLMTKKNPSAYCYSTQTIAITTVRCKWAVLTAHTESRNIRIEGRIAPAHFGCHNCLISLQPNYHNDGINNVTKSNVNHTRLVALDSEVNL